MIHLLCGLVASFAVASMVGCASPTAPSPGVTAQSDLRYPAELAPVIRAIDTDPWIHPLIGEPLGVWLRRHTKAIQFDQAIGPAFVAWAHADRTIGWNPAFADFSHGDIALSVAYLLHEVRHHQGYAHTCGNFDRTMAEGGAYAVQILYLEHAGYQNVATVLRASSIVGCL